MFQNKKILPLLVGLALCPGRALDAQAQGNPSQAEIDKWLDNSSPYPGSSAGAPSGQGQTMPGWPTPQQSGNLRTWPANDHGFSNNMSGWQRPANRSPVQGLPVAPGRIFNTPFGKLTPQDIFRIMFGGPAGGSAAQQAKNQEAYSNASGNLQTALDQAAQAEEAASRASYGSDQGARQAAAAEAQDHANAAREAADAATSTAYGASSEAQDQAAQARDAADRAQYAADRAAANANGGGW